MGMGWQRRLHRAGTGSCIAQESHILWKVVCGSDEASCGGVSLYTFSQLGFGAYCLYSLLEAVVVSV